MGTPTQVRLGDARNDGGAVPCVIVARKGDGAKERNALVRTRCVHHAHDVRDGVSDSA